MCIILYKEKGVELPTKEVLERCDRKNPDGIGLMVKRDGWIRIRKGFMSFEEFWAGYRNEGLTKDDTFAVHFRLATAGGISKGNCHPFPVSDNIWKLKKVKFKQADGITQAVMHNGVLGSGNAFLSDTMLWIRDDLFVLKDHLGSELVLNNITKSTQGSKLLFFDGEEVIKTGIWYDDKDTGICYSNVGYKAFKYANTNVFYVGGKRVKDEDSEFYKKANWRNWRKKPPPTKYYCEVCEAEGNDFSVGFYTEVVLCNTCGYKFDQDGAYVGWDNAIWMEYYYGMDEDVVKCKVCSATDKDYLSWDERENDWFCLTCNDYLGLIEEEEKEEELLCEGCGLDSDYLIEGCCAICNEVKRSQKADKEAQWDLWRIDVCT